MISLGKMMPVIARTFDPPIAAISDEVAAMMRNIKIK
jgi:hypothetical protein